MVRASHWYGVFIVTNLNISIVSILKIVVFTKLMMALYDCVSVFELQRVVEGSSNKQRYAGLFVCCLLLDHCHKRQKALEEDDQTFTHAKP